MASRKGVGISRDEILHQLWDDEEFPDPCSSDSSEDEPELQQDLVYEVDVMIDQVGFFAVFCKGSVP